MSSKGFSARKAMYQREKREALRTEKLDELAGARRCGSCGRVQSSSRAWVFLSTERAIFRLGSLPKNLAACLRGGTVCVCRSCWWKALAAAKKEATQ